MVGHNGACPGLGLMESRVVPEYRERRAWNGIADVATIYVRRLAVPELLAQNESFLLFSENGKTILIRERFSATRNNEATLRLQQCSKSHRFADVMQSAQSIDHHQSNQRMPRNHNRPGPPRPANRPFSTFVTLVEIAPITATKPTTMSIEHLKSNLANALCLQ
jgi:hypothetical protein